MTTTLSQLCLAGTRASGGLAVVVTLWDEVSRGLSQERQFQDYHHVLKDLISQWSAASVYPLGADHRPTGVVRATSAAEHEPGRYSRPDHGVVRPALATEVTFEETRLYLAIEIQRQWSNLAILHTTSVLVGLFSLVTLFAHRVLQGQNLPVRQRAWYTQELSIFSDTLAFMRQQLCRSRFLGCPSTNPIWPKSRRRCSTA